MPALMPTATTNSAVLDEAIENTAFMSELADRVRAEGLSAFDDIDIDIDGDIQEFADALLAEYPAED